MVGEERLDLRERRRKAGEVECEATDQGAPVGSGEEVKPSFSSLASQNASTGVRTRPACFTVGGVIGLDGPECPVVFQFGSGAADAGRRGTGFRPRAPILIQSIRASISFVCNVPLGGILMSWCVLRTACTISEPSGLPGMSAGPFSPPSRIASRVSSRKPPPCLAAPWHFPHDCDNNGRTLRSKCSICSGVPTGAGASARPIDPQISVDANETNPVAKQEARRRIRVGMVKPDREGVLGRDRVVVAASSIV